MASKESQTLRVVVGTEFGPRSAVWRIWTQKNEVYVAPRSLAGEIKTSLHASGRWRHGFTDTARSPFVPAGDRAFYKWQRPPEFVNGATLALRIIVPADELTAPGVEPPVKEKAKTELFAAPPSGWVSYIALVLTAPGRPVDGHPRPERGDSVLLGSWALDSGEMLWVVGHHQPLLPEQRDQIQRLHQTVRAAESGQQPQPGAGQHDRIVGWMSPDEHGVSGVLDVSGSTSDRQSGTAPR
jgi:hypothetical protein